MDGGKSKYETNTAGSSRGTGYCDAQCPHDVKFINGEANILKYKPTTSSTGDGKYGNCCAEMDIFESNRYATSYTAHPCTIKGSKRCEGKDCGDNDANERE